MQQVYRRRYETKAAARQSRIHIKEQKIKCGEKRFSKWRMELLHPAMWHQALESPSGSTLQCDRWLWDDMPWNSPKRPPYWNSTSGFHFDHITAVDMSFCTSLQNFIQIGPPSTEEITSCRFSRWRISAIFGFMGPIMGPLKSPCTASYRSSI